MTTTFKTWFGSIKSLVKDIRALAIFAVLYALLLVTFYIFIATREATVWQVVITYSFLVLLPAEFFVLQASIIQRAELKRFAWGQIARDALRFAVVTIPVILIGWGIWVLLNKWQAHYPAPRPTFALTSNPRQLQSLHWPTLLFSTLRYLIFGVLLPLITIHLWIAVARQGLKSLTAGGAKAIGQRIGHAFVRAVDADSVLIYLLGLIIFGAAPYFILRTTISAKGTKTDFAILIVQLLLAYVVTLIGWVVTVSTLAKMSAKASPAPAAPAAEAQSSLEAAA